MPLFLRWEGLVVSEEAGPLKRSGNSCSRLRDLFGKPIVSEEDSFRLQSIRATAVLAQLRRMADANSLDRASFKMRKATVPFPLLGKQKR